MCTVYTITVYHALDIVRTTYINFIASLSNARIWPVSEERSVFVWAVSPAKGARYIKSVLTSVAGRLRQKGNNLRVERGVERDPVCR